LVKPETKLWYELKRNTNKIIWTRLENKALFGTPDLLGYPPSGNFFTVELKVAKGNKITFSPHQISFHMKHNLNTFILVACALDKGKVRLYPGSRILELVDLGLKLEPLREGLKACCLKLESL
tara:strand:+ start:148 stop:516 length:369 start_codon:yes stop_codon:yes gene_type:complete